MHFMGISNSKIRGNSHDMILYLSYVNGTNQNIILKSVHNVAVRYRKPASFAIFSACHYGKQHGKRRIYCKIYINVSPISAHVKRGASKIQVGK